MSERLDTLGRRLVDAKDEYARLSKAADAASARMRAVEADFWEAAEEANMKTVPLQLGEGYGDVTFTRRETITGRVLGGFEHEAAEALRAMGVAGAILDDRPAVRKKVLNEHVRDWLKQGMPLPAGVDFVATRGVTVTKKRSKK